MNTLVRWLTGVGVFFVMLCSVFFAGRKHAKDKAEAKADVLKAEAKAHAATVKAQKIQAKEEVRREVDTLSDGGAADRLRNKWSRD
jgi:hypothetical protein